MHNSEQREDDSTKDISFAPQEESELDNSFRVVGDIQVGIDQSKDSTVIAKAKRFVELVQHGKKPGEAAKAIGTSLREINNSGTMKEMVARLTETASLPDAVRIQMVQAFLNQTVIQAAVSDDPEILKIGLQAAKQISQEVNIGLTQSDNGVTINLGALEGKIAGITLEPNKGTENEIVPINSN